MKNETYVMVPYEEYQELLKIRNEQREDVKNAIFFRKIIDCKMPMEGDWGFLYDSEVELSVRTHNALKNNINPRFQFVGDLVQSSWADILKIQNLGRLSFNELRAQLERLGLGLNMKLSKSVNDKLEELRATSDLVKNNNNN